MLKLVVRDPLPFEPGRKGEGGIPTVEGAGLGIYLRYSNLKN
jgi:hypothetical protein